MTKIITRKELREALKNDAQVTYKSWRFNYGVMNCSEDCCLDFFNNIDEAVRTIASYVGDNKFCLTTTDKDGNDIDTECILEYYG